MACGQQVNVHLRSDSIWCGKQKMFCNALVIRMSRFLWSQAETAAKRARISQVLAPENVADSNTKFAERHSLKFRCVCMGVTRILKQFVIQSLDDFDFVLCLCVTLTHAPFTCCFTCLHPLMILHIFLSESVNHVHIDHNARAVPLVSSDHIIDGSFHFSCQAQL